MIMTGDHNHDCTPHITSSVSELYLLIAKFLFAGPCKQSAECLKKEIEENGLIPHRLDWTGLEHPQSFLSSLTGNAHIAPNHLLNLCVGFSELLEQVIPSGLHGVKTFLGTGRFSLLRTVEDITYTQWDGKMNSVMRHQQPLRQPHNMKLAPNLCHVLYSSQLNGAARLDRLLPLAMYKNKLSMHKRVLGHLSAVFCLLFDKSGQYILTGADDCLIKVWSMKNCRLLSTLRGHSGEVSDMALNHANTMLASGSCDKTVRLWCLKTGAQITVLHGHTNGVTSVQFCPLVRDDTHHLVSTGSDGCVCFWKYTVSGGIHFESKPTKFIERSRAGAQMLCQSFSPGGVFLATGSTDQSIRVYGLFSAHPEKICEVDPHTDRVDSIQFSNHGDRFMSGSKDGTARIWRYERQEWHFMTLPMTMKLHNVAESQSEESKSKLKVTMVRWSHDDEFVITAVSDYSIKLWNSWNGNLLCVMEGHDDDVFVIEINPADSRIVLTAGHDGKINLWSIPNGKLLRTFTNAIPGQGRGAVFDCKFSVDGQTIAATDSHGHLIVFGLGSSDPYMCVPEEQFFHTDYRPLLRDGHGFVLDEQTQQPPHLMPPPFLVDVDGCPHPVHYQRLVPGRENCCDAQLIPQIGTAENGDREVVGENFIQDAADRVNVDELNRGEVDHHDRDAPVPRAIASPDAHQAGMRGVRRTSGNVPVSQVATNQDLLAWSKRSIIRELDHASLRRCEATIQAHAETEFSRFMKERSRQPKILSRSDSSDGGYNIKTRRKKRIRGSEADMKQMGDTAVNRLVTRALYDTEVEDSSVTDFQEQDDREQLQFSDDENGAESSDYSDWMADAQVNLQPPVRTSKRTRTRHRFASFLTSDEEEEDSQDEDYNAEITEPKMSGSKNVSERPCRNKRVPRKKIQTDTESSVTQTPGTAEKKQKPIVKKAVKEMPPEFAPTEWLTGVLPRKLPYTPQMGDEIVYLRQGHELYVDAVVRTRLYNFDSKTLPYVRHRTMRDVEYAKVIGIKYEVRPPRLASLKLGYINPVTGNLMKESFTIKYHDMADVLDFIILKQTFDHANERNWKVGDRFCSIIDDAWWLGTIVGQRPVDRKYPDSPFQCFRVKWDNGESELMSPWDMEVLEDHRIPSEKGLSKPLSTEDHCSLAYRPKESEWPPCGRDVECDRLVRGLESIMLLSVAEPFIAPVDLNKYPVYGMTIGYLIDLSTIKTRLENHYYRRITALQFDVRYIEMNARKFNETGSEIIKRAKLITKLVLEFIRLTECDNALSLFKGMKQNGRVTSDSDTEIESEHASATVSNNQPKKTDRSPPRKSVRNDYVVTSDSWKLQSRQLLLSVMDMDDATPFREPVDTNLYPQYVDVISEPMDLGTVLTKLDRQHYPDPSELQRDIRLIFKNSKAFNNKKSKIYTMTLRLSAHIEEKFRNILSDWKAAISCERHSKSWRLKPRSSRGIAVRVSTEVGSASKSMIRPSTSGSRTRPPRTRSKGTLTDCSLNVCSDSDELSSEATDCSISDGHTKNGLESEKREWGNRSKKGKATSAHQIKRSKPKKKQDIDSCKADNEASELCRSEDITDESESDDDEDTSDSVSNGEAGDRPLQRNARPTRASNRSKRKFVESWLRPEDQMPLCELPPSKRRRRNLVINNGSLSTSTQRTSLRNRGKNPRYNEVDSEDDEDEGSSAPIHSVSSRGRLRTITEKARRANNVR